MQKLINEKAVKVRNKNNLTGPRGQNNHNKTVLFIAFKLNSFVITFIFIFF